MKDRINSYYKIFKLVDYLKGKKTAIETLKDY